MACYSPLRAFKDHEHNIVFSDSCESVIYELKLPCGQCIGCRLERSRQWAVRCMHEAQLHEENSFLTLTFDDDHLESPSLNKRDFQLFMKRLRKKFKKKKIRYYHCGEYGEKFGRPHHHACLFGLDFPDKKLFKITKRGDRLYTSDILNSLWGHGYCIIGDLTFESAAYVARYVTKKITGKKAGDHYERVTPDGEILSLEPEYNSMSRRPGIGFPWIEKYLSDVYPHDEVVIRGKKCRPPRFYDKYIEKHYPSLYENIKINREESVLLFQSENSLDRLVAKHEVKVVQSRKLKRPYEFNGTEFINARSDIDRQIINFNKGRLR